MNSTLIQAFRLLSTLLISATLFAQTNTTIRTERDDTGPATCAEGAQCLVRGTTNRAIHSNLRDSSGTELGVAGDPLNVEGTVSCTLSEPISVDDNAASLTVDGTVICDAGTNLNTSALALETSVDGLENNTANLQNTHGTDGGAGPSRAISIGGTTSGGNLEEIQVDSDGQLQIDVISVPTTTVTATNLDVQIGGSDSLTIGTFPDNEPFRISDGTDIAEVLNLAANDPLSVAIVDGSGTQITSFGGGTQYTEDAVAAADPTGTNPMLVADSTPGLEVADGDNVAQRATRYGAAYTQIVSSSGSFIDSFGGGTEYTDDTSTHSTGVTVGNAMMAAAAPTDASVDANDLGVPAMSTDRRLRTDSTIQIGDSDAAGGSGTNGATVQRITLATDDELNDDADAIRVATETLDNAISGSEMQVDVVAALPSGTNNIGDVDVLTLPALAAGTNNIGDVDVLSIAAGTNAIGNVGIIPRTSGGLDTFHLVSAASTNATSVKASAGQLFGWFIYNSNASARKVAFHNTSGTPTAGSSIFFSLVIPPSSGANVFSETGVTFGTGIGITTVTGLADSDSTGVAANDLIINLWYE